jgi:hypothetical protein
MFERQFSKWTYNPPPPRVVNLSVSHGFPGSTLDAGTNRFSIGCDITYKFILPTCVAFFHRPPPSFCRSLPWCFCYLTHCGFPCCVLLRMSELAYAELTPRNPRVKCEWPACGKVLPPGIDLYILHDNHDSSNGFGVCPDCKLYYEGKGAGIVIKKKGNRNLNIVSRTGEFLCQK